MMYMGCVYQRIHTIAVVCRYVCDVAGAWCTLRFILIRMMIGSDTRIYGDTDSVCIHGAHTTYDQHLA